MLHLPSRRMMGTIPVVRGENPRMPLTRPMDNPDRERMALNKGNKKNRNL
jgi:hypothetical protein